MWTQYILSFLTLFSNQLAGDLPHSDAGIEPAPHIQKQSLRKEKRVVKARPVKAPKRVRAAQPTEVSVPKAP